MARRRKSEEQAKLDGTYNATRQKGRSTKLPPAKLSPPEWLDDAARKVFRQAVADLEAAGILAKADTNLVAHYAFLESLFQQEPLVFTAAMHTQLRLLRAEVGLTPQGRLKVDGNPQEEKDPAEAFFH